MNSHKLNFQLEHLTVDWIEFNIEGSIDILQIANLASYFFKLLGFNSILGIDNQYKQADIFHDSKNRYVVSFRQKTKKSHWQGYKIIFSSKNAAYFYNLIKTQRFDWSKFQIDNATLSLSRFDLCYDRPNHSTHTGKSFYKFLGDSKFFE